MFIHFGNFATSSSGFFRCSCCSVWVAFLQQCTLTTSLFSLTSCRRFSFRCNDENNYLISNRSQVELYAFWIQKFYFPSHLRIGPWTIGIMLGYVLYVTRGEKVKINKILDATFWVLAISLFFSVNIGHYAFIQIEDYETPNMFIHSLYGSFFRIASSISVAWIIFACQNGSGGIVRWFLSLKQWQPFGRMGLSIYLVHRMYQIITTYNLKQPMQFDFSTKIQQYWGDVLVALFFGTLLYLAVETPIMLIENYLHKKLKKPEVNNKG